LSLTAEEAQRFWPVYNRFVDEQEKLRKLSIQSEREEIKLKKDQQAALDREAKAREKVARETAKQNSAYSQESAKLNELRKRYKDLAVQNKENTAEARNLLTQITALDGKLKQIDATVGQHQRNVGNYQQALGKLSGFLGQFGVAFGIGTIVQGATRSVIEFDQALEIGQKSEREFSLVRDVILEKLKTTA
jgi:chromosome segregation ATPase